MAVHTRRHSALMPRSMLVALASHAAIGMALGLASGFALIWIPAFHVTNLVNDSMDPWATTLILIATFATTFGIDATLTGFILMMSQNDTARVRGEVMP
jgi:polyferredoxin